MTVNNTEGTFYSDEGKNSPEKKKRTKKPPHLGAQDYELLSILQVDKEQYFVEVDNRFRRQLYAYLRKKAPIKSGFSSDDIEDFVQITIERFCIWIEKQKKASEPIALNHKAYLLIIARNVYLDEIENRTKHSTVSLDNPVSTQGENTNTTLADLLFDPHHEDEQERKMFVDTVRDTIERLREPYRTVMWLKASRWNDQEISEHLRRKLDTVKSQVKRGRKILEELHPEYKEYF